MTDDGPAPERVQLPLRHRDMDALGHVIRECRVGAASWPTPAAP